MKKLINRFLIFAMLQFCFLSFVNGQESTPASQNNDPVFTKVEQMPEFHGGDKKLEEYLLSNLKYPEVAKENGITGKVYISFVVDRTGRVRDAKILRGISKE